MDTDPCPTTLRARTDRAEESATMLTYRVERLTSDLDLYKRFYRNACKLAAERRDQLDKCASLLRWLMAEADDHDHAKIQALLAEIDPPAEVLAPEAQG